MTALHLSVTVLDEPGVPVLLVGGLPGHREEIAFVVDGRAVRPLWPSRSTAARRPERPLDAGLPSLATILRGAVHRDARAIQTP